MNFNQLIQGCFSLLLVNLVTNPAQATVNFQESHSPIQQQSVHLTLKAREKAPITERNLRNLLEQMATAANNRDVDRLFSFYAPNYTGEVTITTATGSETRVITREESRQRLELSYQAIQNYQFSYSQQDITISDDGRGIDPELIRQKVVERGFLTEEQASELSMAELYDFLFWPGFSTTKEVTDLSGRGVGLDVVRTNLRQVRGTVKVDSRLGKGTSFIIKLPLLLSITEALLVNLDNHILAIPLDAVEEIIKMQPEQIHIAGDRPMICWRDEFIRLVRLADLLPYNSPYPDQASPKREQDFIPVLILNSSEGVLAVIVDYLAGQQEIVVKALPTPLSKPKGVIGNTILGDGRVVTIIDVDDLIEHFHPHNHGAITVPDHDSPKFPQAPHRAPKILVVDDSYTLRQLVSLSLSRARYRVEQAKDGLDAIHQLERGLDCDLIIADIEMPRMDGFELLRSLKHHANWAKIPVVMLTSRSGQKHRQLATELGAIDYFTKPYNEARFLIKIANILDNHRVSPNPMINSEE